MGLSSLKSSITEQRQAGGSRMQGRLWSMREGKDTTLQVLQVQICVRKWGGARLGARGEVGGVGPGVVDSGIGKVVRQVLDGPLAGDDGLHEEAEH
eukprot:c5552_g1_i1 orf=41-328(-)